MRSGIIVTASLLAALALTGSASAQGAALRTQPEPYRHVVSVPHPTHYQPCPADVTFADGRHACLGCPAGCGY